MPQYEAQVGSLTQQITSLKDEMTKYWETQETTKQKEIDDLNTKIEQLQKDQLAQIEKADPAQSQFYDQQTIILQNQLDAAEVASTKLLEDFNKAMKLMGASTWRRVLNCIKRIFGIKIKENWFVGMDFSNARVTMCSTHRNKKGEFVVDELKEI